MIRQVFEILFAIFIVILSWCAYKSYRSGKVIGRPVGLLCLSLIPPVLGNLIIIGSHTRAVSLVGCYIYYIGMDLIMLALIRFTNYYCAVDGPKRKRYRAPVWVYCLLLIDIAQLLLNPFFGHAFSLQEIEAYGAPYFAMIPHLGQTYHRVVCYGTILMVMMIFVVAYIKVPKIYRERYAVILISMIIGTVWQTYYIFSRTPVDRSMVGFAVFGILIFYFSIYYRPVRLLDSMLANIVSKKRDAVFLYELDGRCIWINENGRRLVHSDGTDAERDGEALSAIFTGLEGLPENQVSEFTIHTLEGHRYYLVERGGFDDENGKRLGFYVSIRDNTEEKKRYKQEIYLANHDALTGLYNKKKLFQKISEALSRHDLSDYYIAFIDVRDFKIVNDVFGKDFGDLALQQIADWIRKYSNEDCIFGRIGGDTFGSCFPKSLLEAEKIEEDLSKFAIVKGDRAYHLVMNVGLCNVTDQDEDEDVSILFDRAHMAVSSIRDDYKRHVALFDNAVREQMKWDQEISAQLPAAIAEGQIVPYLQPIVDRSGKIVGAEALARWMHPEYGFMPPIKFIPLFEENGMIIDLDRHIWRCACRILSGWKEKFPGIFLSVNISPKDFFLTDILSEVRQLVEEYRIPSRTLRIEVTETSMMNNADGRMEILKKFREDDFIVEMDDFGSGYSSLNVLKDMPVDVLKIDMKFLGKAENEDRANIIVRNVIRLSEELGIHSLTEGVESKEQFELLSDMGCKLFQGYYFSKPVTVEAFEEMLTHEA